MDYIRPEFFFQKLEVKIPRLIGLWEALKNWPYSLFYIFAEMWGTFGITVLFWTFVNDITSMKQSKRFYSFLAIGANLGSLVTGFIQKLLGTRYNIMVLIVLACSSLVLVIYSWMSRDMKLNPNAYQIEPKVKKVKAKMGFMESLKFLVRSKALALIAAIVLAYNMIINLLEAAWKSQIDKMVKIYGKESTIADDIYANQNIWLGVITIAMILILSAPIMRRGWRFAALVTPVVAAIMGTFFFSFLLFGDKFNGIVDYFNTTSLHLAVIFGLIQVIFIKSAKYSLFDPTKESAYIPLSEDEKVKGKSAVDGVGGRLGKGAASFILTTILVPIFGAGKLDNVKGYIVVLAGALLVLWIIAVNALGNRLEEISSSKPQEDK
jgi:AAA family ATP:ADP antiporter